MFARANTRAITTGMSNRTDWPALAAEIASANTERLERELHNAFVAGREATDEDAVGYELQDLRRIARIAHRMVKTYDGDGRCDLDPMMDELRVMLEAARDTSPIVAKLRGGPNLPIPNRTPAQDIAIKPIIVRPEVYCVDVKGEPHRAGLQVFMNETHFFWVELTRTQSLAYEQMQRATSDPEVDVVVTIRAPREPAPDQRLEDKNALGCCRSEHGLHEECGPR